MNLNWVLSDWLQKGLLATAYGPLYPGVHALSVLSVCVASFYVGWVQRSAPWAALVGFAVIAVHELVWAGLSLFYYGYNLVAGDSYIVIYSVLVGVFLLLGRKHFGTMLASVFIAIAVYTFSATFAPQMPFILSDTAAIACWAIVCIPWFFVRKA